MADEFDKPAQRLSFTLDEFLSGAGGGIAASLSDQASDIRSLCVEHLTNRVRHHAAWCLDKQTDHEFYHIFHQGQGKTDLRSRLVKIQVSGSGVNITFEPETAHPPPTAMMLLVNQISDRIPEGLAVATFVGSDTSNGMLTYVNATLADMLETNRERLLGMFESDLIGDPATRLPQMVQGENPVASLPIKLKRADGSTFLAHLKRKVVTDPTGWLTHAVITCQDVEQELALHEQQEQERVLNERMQRLAKVGWWELDLEADLSTWSQGMYRLYDLEPSDSLPPIKQTIEQVVAADRSRVYRMLKETMEHGREASTEVRVMVAGEERWQRLQAFPGRTEDGRMRTLHGTAIDITDTVQSEQLRLQQHQELEFYLSCLDEHALLLKLDDQFRITFANGKFVETLRFTKSELMGRELSSLGLDSGSVSGSLSGTLSSSLSKKAALTDEPFKIALKQDRVWFGEMVQVRKDGALINLEVTMSVSSVADRGEVFFFANDVTHRKLVDRVSRSVAKLQASEPGIHNVTAQVLQELIEVTGSEWGLVKAGMIEVSFPEGFSSVAMQRLAKTALELELRTKPSGSLMLFNRPGSYDAMVCDIIKPLVGIIVETQINEQRVIQEREKEFENRFLLETLKIGSWKRDVKNNSWFFSDGMFELVNYPATKGGVVPYQFWQQHIPPSEQNKLRDCLREILETNETCDTTVVLSISDRGTRYINVQGRVIRDARGEPREVLGIASDVTAEETTRLELENQKSLASHQARLASIGELAAGVGHEINNPLTIIRGFLEIMKHQLGSDGPDMAEIAELVEKMDDSAGRIEKIVKGLRSLSHVDEDRTEYFSPAPILKDTIGFVDEIYRRQGVELDMASDVPASARLRGHQGKLQQVLMNLLSNARDATDNQSSRKIRARFTVEQGRQLVISVEDNGAGVADELRERIFHPFFTTKEIGKGTGIGLSMVHSIVQEFQGQVECRRAELGGAEFRVTLPLVAAELDRPSGATDPMTQKQNLSGRVLVVDDEEGVREFMVLFLQQLGLVAESAANGRFALEKVFSHGEPFDLVISDLTMPEMDGLEFVEQLQLRLEQEQSTKRPKVLLATGRPDFTIKLEDYPLVAAVMTKPFDLASLREKISELLQVSL